MSMLPINPQNAPLPKNVKSTLDKTKPDQPPKTNKEFKKYIKPKEEKLEEGEILQHEEESAPPSTSTPFRESAKARLKERGAGGQFLA